MADDRSKNDKKAPPTLNDADITTDRTAAGRRRFLGLMGAGAAVGAAATLTGGQAQAQATDADNGNWTDAVGCGRGSGGVYSGVTDADNGNITDAGGYGRGAPYC